MEQFCKVCNGLSNNLRHSTCRSCQSFYYRAVRGVIQISDSHCNGDCLDMVRFVDTGSRKYRFICKSCRFTKCQQLIDNCHGQQKVLVKRSLNEGNENSLGIGQKKEKMSSPTMALLPSGENMEGKLTSLLDSFRLFVVNMRNTPLSKIQSHQIPSNANTIQFKYFINHQVAKNFNHCAQSAISFLKQIPEFQTLNLQDRAVLFPNIAYRLFTILDLFLDNGAKFNCSKAIVANLFSVYPENEGLVVSHYMAKKAASDWKATEIELAILSLYLIFYREF